LKVRSSNWERYSHDDKMLALIITSTLKTSFFKAIKESGIR
jgi:hypothetical protein